jgi:hypothetical protein
MRNEMILADELDIVLNLFMRLPYHQITLQDMKNCLMDAKRHGLLSTEELRELWLFAESMDWTPKEVPTFDRIEWATVGV